MPSDNIYAENRIPTQRQRSWLLFRKNSLSMFGFWCLLLIIALTIFAPLFAPYSPFEQHLTPLTPPSWSNDGHIEYFLGTDDLGRDILSRLLYGAQITFGYTVLITLAAAVVGILIGAAAGMTQGVKSSILNHLLDTVLFIPSLLLAIILVAFMGASQTTVLISIWLALIPRFIRSTYTAVHEEIEKDYTVAAKLDGASSFYIFYHSILPNILPAIATNATRAFSIAILDFSALGFLGLGAQSPSPEWGTMLGDSIELVYNAPWTVTLPGFSIMLTVLVINLVGDGIRQAINAGTD
ncbi:peptide ABC transporter permease SapC [Vibrio sp. SS-MA-C1-2]|uniref:putrescine export ABC transporter permease SapC n=1 Tax=Vibrio sp. SS-MA-C1-2 TaxID=2908646 RepID=UPI001F4393CC|nr:putrescine export ABC transporter permease SapC [Vibrio sp. SS-MA-C1-2]UJF19979.1 peptide ABC transporter permease SapC [Vibrio sp. SS-MA-C1-2]